MGKFLWQPSGDCLSGSRVGRVVLDSPPPADPERFVQALRTHIIRTYDPLAQPDEVYFVSQLPLNLAAKNPRKLIRLVYEGKRLDSSGSLINPEAVEEIRRSAGEANRSKMS
jgi:acyl-coenzyme A synthetase/AMP-(fatty) acid ligase